ncbi:hypothetical protein BpHYR1_009128 [Brachionus plicatilis]|uniref:CCHC-type domain-containing protein n=1 Tax=Brachionus plicatilis TaxID=10195 RepID=A0A3M7SFW3_BRAPC|nr:hypothetical protein BpHYR1_009128 [Brachionus plicatilis]
MVSEDVLCQLLDKSRNAFYDDEEHNIEKCPVKETLCEKCHQKGHLTKKCSITEKLKSLERKIENQLTTIIFTMTKKKRNQYLKLAKKIMMKI